MLRFLHSTSLSFLQKILTRLDFLGNGNDNETEYEMLTTNSTY